MPSLDLRQPQQFLFCKVEFYLQHHYTSRAHLLRLAKLYHANLWTVYYGWSIVKIK